MRVKAPFRFGYHHTVGLGSRVFWMYAFEFTGYYKGGRSITVLNLEKQASYRAAVRRMREEGNRSWN